MGYDLSGLGMARPALTHQRITRNIVINFCNKFGFEEIEAFQECTANTKPTCEKIPDVVFWDLHAEKVVVSIELEKYWNTETIEKIVQSLLKKFKHKEVFLYNYVKMKWRRYYLKGKEAFYDETDYSEVLGINLSEFVDID